MNALKWTRKHTRTYHLKEATMQVWQINQLVLKIPGFMFLLLTSNKPCSLFSILQWIKLQLDGCRYSLPPFPAPPPSLSSPYLDAGSGRRPGAVWTSHRQLLFSASTKFPPPICGPARPTRAVVQAPFKNVICHGLLSTRLRFDPAI